MENLLNKNTVSLALIAGAKNTIVSIAIQIICKRIKSVISWHSFLHKNTKCLSSDPPFSF